MPLTRSRFVCGALCSILLFVSPTLIAETVSGYLPGDFDVDATGNASYLMPIEIPAGVAEVQPKLAFSFNSSGAYGLLGKGWSFTGISSIRL